MKQELMNTEIELINEDEAFQLGGANEYEMSNQICGNLRECSWNNDTCPKLEKCGWN